MHIPISQVICQNKDDIGKLVVGFLGLASHQQYR